MYPFPLLSIYNFIVLNYITRFIYFLDFYVMWNRPLTLVNNYLPRSAMPPYRKDETHIYEAVRRFVSRDGPLLYLLIH